MRDRAWAVCVICWGAPPSGPPLIRTSGNQHRFVLTLHHIVVDGWSLPILLQEIFASYFRQRLPASRRIAASSPGWPGRIATPRTRRGARCSRGFDTPTLVAAPAAPGPRAVDSFRISAETTKALGSGRAQHTTVSTVLQAGWAQVLM